jgi:formylglycine-generating enzyme required for sulfatase activity
MYPVTNAAYQQFIDDDGYKQQAFWSADGWKWLQESRVIGPEYYKNFIDGQKPCVGISWYEADAYARWRGGRLPTEAEWEYAARGPQSNIYPWGNFWDERRANTSDGGPGTTTPVTHYENGKSWCGAYDLAGNVWEWASDWYDRGYYQRLIANDPQGPTSGDYLVVRGGSWLNLPITARGAARSRYNADFRYHDVGARVVLDAEST